MSMQKGGAEEISGGDGAVEDKVADRSTSQEEKADLELMQLLLVATQESTDEFVQDCREIMMLIAEKIRQGRVSSIAVSVPPSIALLPVLRINRQSGDLEITAYSLDINSSPDEKHTDVLRVLENVKPPIFPDQHLSKEPHKLLLKSLNLLEVVTAYLEKTFGVSNDLSKSREPDFAEALPLLENAAVTSPTAGHPEKHRIDGRDIVIDDIKLWLFKEQLLAFVRKNIQTTDSLPPVSVRTGLKLVLPILTGDTEGRSPQSLLPEGTDLGEATRGLIMTALLTTHNKTGR